MTPMSEVPTKPLVSVIVPVYNGEAHLAQTLESALMQRHVEVELIVVDDGSTDQSPNIIKAYTPHQFRQMQQGPGAARNLGVKHATANYFAFLDQDDLWHPDKLALQLQALKTGDYAVCRAVALLEDQHYQSMIRASFENGAVAPTPSAFLIPRSTFMQVGWFDTRFQTGSDVAWLAAANRLGLKMVCPDELLLTKRFHRHNQGHQVQLGQQELLRILREHRGRQ
jgi:glycosyltransferase involved in cell wall biosynthesis